jgi:ParB family chromosome partitioning protein
VRHLVEKLSEQLGARVQIMRGGGGKGRLVIHYSSLDELDGILEKIK